MELKEIFYILKRKIILIIVIVLLSIAGSFYFSINAKNKYETSSILTIQANRESTDQYQYGGFYSIQASDLFANTILGWIKSPNIVAEIFKKSGVSFDDKKIKSLANKIYAKKVPPQNIMLTITDDQMNESKNIADSTISLIKEKTGQLALVANSSTNFEIISSDPITTTISPNIPFNVAIAFIVALIFSIFIIFVIEYLSPTVNSAQKVRSIFNKDPISLREFKLKGLVNPDTKEAEKFRFLRANMSVLGEKEKTTIVVGGLNEQTTTPLLAANLALSFARSGKKTILIDANFLNPVIHEYFGKQNEFGLSEFLFDEKNISKYLQQTEEKNLQIISSGIKLSYASDTIERADIEKVLDIVNKEAEAIVINVPALNVSSEAFPLFAIANKVLLVTKIGKTNISAANHINSFLDSKNVEKYIVII